MKCRKQIINPLSSVIMAASLFSLGTVFPFHADADEKASSSAAESKAPAAAAAAVKTSSASAPEKNKTAAPSQDSRDEDSGSSKVDTEKLDRVPEGVVRKPIYAYANFFYIMLLRGKIDFLKKVCQTPFYFENRKAE